MRTEPDVRKRRCRAGSPSGDACNRGDHWSLRVGLAVSAVRTVGNWLFRNEDARARQHDWEIRPRHGGLIRTYNDLRFNDLGRHSACAGPDAEQER